MHTHVIKVLWSAWRTPIIPAGCRVIGRGGPSQSLTGSPQLVSPPPPQKKAPHLPSPAVRLALRLVDLGRSQQARSEWTISIDSNIKFALSTSDSLIEHLHSFSLYVYF